MKKEDDINNNKDEKKIKTCGKTRTMITIRQPTKIRRTITLISAESSPSADPARTSLSAATTPLRTHS